jgi:hypothetical protein
MCIELNVFLFTDLEWKVVYVGSGENESFDQELDSVLVGPVPVGLMNFYSKYVYLFQVRTSMFRTPRRLIRDYSSMIT